MILSNSFLDLNGLEFLTSPYGVLDLSLIYGGLMRVELILLYLLSSSYDAFYDCLL